MTVCRVHNSKNVCSDKCVKPIHLNVGTNLLNGIAFIHLQFGFLDQIMHFTVLNVH